MTGKYRFRLRTLLMIITAIAIALAPYTWTARQRSALAQIRGAGGYVSFERNDDPKSFEYVMLKDAGGFFRRTVMFIYGLELLDSPVGVIFVDSKVNDTVVKNVIESLKRIPTIRRVQFDSNTKVTADCLRLLESVPHLDTCVVLNTSTNIIWYRDSKKYAKREKSENQSPQDFLRVP